MDFSLEKVRNLKVIVFELTIDEHCTAVEAVWWTLISVRGDDLCSIIANDEGQITWIDLSVRPRQSNSRERVLSIVKRLERVVCD